MPLSSWSWFGDEVGYGALVGRRQIEEMPGAIVFASERRILDPLYPPDADDGAEARQVGPGLPRVDPTGVDQQPGWRLAGEIDEVGCRTSRRQGGLVMKTIPGFPSS